MFLAQIYSQRAVLRDMNECVKNLLRDNNPNLDIRETKDGKVLVQDLTDLRVTNEKELVDLQRKGQELRMAAETKFNSQSSFLHTVFCINSWIED